MVFLANYVQGGHTSTLVAFTTSVAMLCLMTWKPINVTVVFCNLLLGHALPVKFKATGLSHGLCKIGCHPVSNHCAY